MRAIILLLILVACGNEVDSFDAGDQFVARCREPGWLFCTTDGEAYDAHGYKYNIESNVYMRLPAGETVVLLNDSGSCHFWCND